MTIEFVEHKPPSKFTVAMLVVFVLLDLANVACIGVRVMANKQPEWINVLAVALLTLTAYMYYRNIQSSRPPKDIRDFMKRKGVRL